MKKISIILLNYCTKSLIEKNISNLLNAYENCEIIFVDSGSSDGSADLVQEKYGTNSKVTLIRSKNNGIASGYNLGLKKATGDYILYLGTDAFPTKQALLSFVAYMDENPDVGLATGMLYLRDESIDKDAHRGFPTPWASLSHFLCLDKLFPRSKAFSGYYLGYRDISSVHEIDLCTSHFMFVRPSVHQKIGFWDENFWVFGEDVDFCYRVKQAGFKIMYLGNIKVLHYKGAAIGRNTSKDIDSALTLDFNSVDFKGGKIEKSTGSVDVENKEKVSKVKVSNIKLWMKIKIAKESARAMRTFYKKHYIKKYPLPLTGLVFIGIWCTEKIKLARIWLKTTYKLSSNIL